MRINWLLLCLLAYSLAFALTASPGAQAACVDTDFDANTVYNQPIPTTAPHDGWAGVDVNGVKRPFCLVIPPSYDGSRQVPLILMFHGGNNSAQSWRRERHDLIELVAPEGVVVAVAQGYRPDVHVGPATWNAVHCCRPSFKEQIDDVGYAAAIVDALTTRLAIDPDRVYAFGGSNGGMITHRLAAERPDLFAAVTAKSASVGGQPSKSEPLVEIQPTAPVPILMIHGLRDQNVNYFGGINKGDWRRDLSIRNSVGLWVWSNECSPDPEQASSGSGVRIEKYVGCASNSEVVAVSIQNMGHGWGSGDPPQHAHKINKMLVAFFEHHTQ